ncbi:unnamed protein product [Effrenium voratum]|nr:unnamed protein product [Effrenium voratum]
MPLARKASSAPRYKLQKCDVFQVPKNALPGAESLAMTVDRVMPFWNDTIAPCVMAGKNVLVAAHGNSLRAICKYLEAWFTDANGVSPKFGRAPVHLKSGDLLFSDDGASIPLNTGGRPPYMRFGEGCLVSLSHGPSSFAYFDSGTTDISVVPLIL